MSANPNSPFGLRPVGSLMPSAYSGAVMRCLISASDANDMGVGDPVDLYGDADTPGFTPTVKLATAGATNPIFGVITSLEMDPSSLYTPYRAGSAARYCYVNIDPYAIFEVQAGATVLAYTTVGLNADVAYAYGVWKVMISLHRLRVGGVNTAGTALVGPLGV